MTHHALLSASGAKKWLSCTPSARLEATLPNEESEYASAGTFAHSVFEHRLLGFLGRKQSVECENQLPGADKYYNEDLCDTVQLAVDRVIARIEEIRATCPDAVVLLEQRLDYSQWVQDGSGTTDVVIIADGCTEVMDYKNGSGVSIPAFRNPQLRLYLLGAISEFSHLYNIDTLRGTILQPRLHNYSSEELSVEELLAWAKEVVVPAAKLAFVGEGAFNPGDHCKTGFCRARAICTARADANLALAKQEFALGKPDLLTHQQIENILPWADEVINWLGDVQAHALKQATEGVKFKDFKLVEGRSTRKYKDQDAVAATLQANGVPEEIIYERSLLGITAMEKALGKKQFALLLSELVEKPVGRPTLVPATDKRMEITSASLDFEVAK